MSANAMRLKAQIKNLAKNKNVKAQVIQALRDVCAALL
jgi:hypothetical protein